MHVDARAYDDIWKKQFSGIPSHGLKWENKTSKLKRSILEPQDANYHIEENEMLIPSVQTNNTEGSYLAILKPWKVRREIKLYSLTSSWQGNASDQDYCQ